MASECKFEALEQRCLLSGVAATNVDLTSQSGNEVESSTAVNPTNPLNIVSVCATDGTGGGAILVSRSTNGGASWSVTTVGAAQDHVNANNPRNDPRCVFDAYGNLYISYMVGLTRRSTAVPVIRSADGGASFSDATFAVITAGPDFPVMATGVDARSSRRQAIYLAYTDYAANRVEMVTAVSTGLGQWGSFSKAVAVSHGFGATPSLAVGPAGQLAVAWQSTATGSGPSLIYVNVSASPLVLGFARHDGFASSTNVGGAEPIAAQPNRTIFASPNVAFDNSRSSTRGRLFVAYVDAPAVGSADTNIELRTTDTLGSRWSNAVQVNDDASRRSQFMPALAVDLQSGTVGMDWYDARDSSRNTSVRCYGAVSTNHGASFGPNVAISSGSSVATNARYLAPAVGTLDLGDYIGVAFSSGKLIASWADNSNALGGNPNGSTDFDIYSAAIPTTVFTTATRRRATA